MEENKNDDINLSQEKSLAKIEEPMINSNSIGPIILLISSIIVVVIICVLAFESQKTKVEKFVEIITDDYMFELFEELAPYTYKKGKVVSTLEINPEMLQIALEIPQIPMNRLALVSEQNVDGFDSSGKVYLDIDNTEIASLKYAKTDDAIGFMVPDLINEYIVIKNENLKDVARKIGMSGDEIESIPDKITISEIKKLLVSTEKEDEGDNLELFTVLEKYKEPLFQYLEERVMITQKQSIDIKDKEYTATKHSIALTEKESYELIKILLELLKEDTDLYNVLKEDNSNFEYETFEDWQKDINLLLEDVEKNLVDADNELDIIALSAYTRYLNTIAIELELPLQAQKIRIATANRRNEYYTEISGLFVYEDVILTMETMKKQNLYEGDISIVVLGSEEGNSDLNLISYSIKHEKKAELETLDLNKDFVLNNETEESIENKFEEIKKSLWSYAMTIISRIPENSGDSLDEENMSDAEFSEENQVFILEESNKLFDQIEYGMTKDEVITLIGETPIEEIYDQITYLTWEDEYYNSLDVIIEGGVVVGASRFLFSDAYSNIKLSSELRTELEDLNTEIEKIKEGMTLEEVTQILGDKYFQSYKSVTNEASYEWFDKDENNVVIDFDENGKVLYISEVMRFF